MEPAGLQIFWLLTNSLMTSPVTIFSDLTSILAPNQWQPLQKSPHTLESVAAFWDSKSLNPFNLLDFQSQFSVCAGWGHVAAAGDLLHHDRGGAGAALGLPDELPQLQPGPGAGKTSPPPLSLWRTDNINKSNNRESGYCFIIAILKSMPPHWSVSNDMGDLL